MNTGAQNVNTQNWRQSPRKLGLFAIAGGCVLCFFGVWLPTHEAMNHAASVPVSVEGTVLIPLFLVEGAFYAAMPSLAVRIFGMPADKKGTVWLAHIPLLILGFLLYTAVKNQIVSHGYHF